MKAVDGIRAEIDKRKRIKMQTGKTDPQLTRALISALRYFDWGDGSKEISLEEFIEKLSDPLFVIEIRNLGPKGAKLLISHFKEPNPGGWG